jgi:hypothetical protein
MLPHATLQSLRKIVRDPPIVFFCFVGQVLDAVLNLTVFCQFLPPPKKQTFSHFQFPGYVGGVRAGRFKPYKEKILRR